MTKRQSVRPFGPIVRFGLFFGILLSAYYFIILQPWCDRALYEYLRVNAQLSGALLRLYGEQAEVHETTIRAAGYAISVRRGCDAVEPAWLFAAAVLGFPAPGRRKWLFLAGGVAIILLLNLVRISSLFVIGRRLPGFFATAHLEIWPALLVLCAAGLWLFWIRSLRFSDVAL